MNAKLYAQKVMYYTSIDDNNKLVDYIVWCYVYKCPKCNYETTNDKSEICPKCKTHLTSNFIHYKFFNDQLYKIYLANGQMIYIPIRNIYRCNPCKDSRKINGNIKIGHYIKQLQKNDEFYYNGFKIIFINKNNTSQSTTPINRKITIVNKGKVESVHEVIPQLKISNIKYDFTLVKEFNDNISTICNDLEKFIKYFNSRSCYSSLHQFINLLHNAFATSIINLEVDEDEDEDDVISYLKIMKSFIEYVQSVCKHYDEVYKHCKLLKELGYTTVDGLTQEDINEILSNKVDTAKYLKYKLSDTNSYSEMANEIRKYIIAIRC